MNGVIYARYSAGPGQTDQSIDGQLRDCKKYAKDNDITIIDTYIDRHISGTDFENRTEFNRLLKDAVKHQFSVVIVWKIDRFGRNRQELAISKVKLKKMGVKLMYAKEHIPEGPEGIIMESLLEGMAEYYSAELSQKVHRGLRESVLKGHILGANACLGYKLVDKKYVLDPATAPQVREMFERYAAGDTAQEICDDWSRRGLRGRGGARYSHNTIYYMLRNKKYIGIYQYGDIIQENVIPRIIDQELWDRVQKILAANCRNRSLHKATAPEEFLLTGKLLCGYCGRGIAGDSGTGQHGETHHYYKCSSRKKKTQPCELRTYRKEELESLVIDSTRQDVLTDDVIDYLVGKLLEIQKEDAVSTELQRLYKCKKEVQKSIDNMVRAIEQGIITDSTKGRLVELEQQRTDLDTEIAREEIQKPELTDRQIRYWLLSFRQGNEDDPEFRTKLINTFVNSIYLYNDYMIIVYNFTVNADAQKHAISQDELKKIAKDRYHCLISSDGTGRVPATGVEPVRDLSPTGF